MDVRINSCPVKRAVVGALGGLFQVNVVLGILPAYLSNYPVFAEASGAYPFLLFGAMMILQFFVVLFFYPETKQLSLERLQHQLEDG
jgi:hypothetical protein